jgi:phytoene desaturase
MQFDGCTFDTGPSLLTMPFVLEQFFDSMGTSMQEHIQLTEVSPACRYAWSDGTLLTMPSTIDHVADAVGAISARDAARVHEYFREARWMYEATKDIFLFAPFKGIAELWSAKNRNLLRFLPRLRSTQTLHQAHRSFFFHPKVVQLFDRFATYNGSNPYKAPATLMIIPWVEFGFGAWFAMGGMYRIAQAIEHVATQAGVQILCSQRVAKVQRKNGMWLVTSESETQQEFSADVVVWNGDSHALAAALGNQPKPLSRHRKTASSSAVVLLTSVESSHGELAHHNIFFSDDYPQEFREIFSRHTPCSNPTIYVARSCATDASLAAEGLENWFVMVNAPATGDGRWAEIEQEYGQHVVDVTRRFVPQLRVRSMVVRTPDTMAQQWGSVNGALYGRASNSMFSAFLRTPLQHPQLKNLWYVGGTAHPGGGIPLVITSGTLAATSICSLSTSS